MHPLVGNGIGDVLLITDSDELYLYNVAKDQDIGTGFKLIWNKYIAVGRLDDQRGSCAGVIDGEIEMVRVNFLNGRLRLRNQLVGVWYIV